MPVTVKVNGAANSLVHKGSNGISIATIPDVCKTPTPGGPVPMPYPNISQSATLSNGTTTVKADGMMIAVKGSEFSISNGDQPGTVGGVKSNVFMKESTWILYSFDVKMDGKNACRLTDKKFHNHENTVNIAGVLQNPVFAVAGTDESDLRDLAKKCNEAVNNAKGPATKKNCAALGTAKHKCCEDSIKAGDRKTLGAEQPFELDGSPSLKNRAAAIGMGAAAKAAAKAAGVTAKKALTRAFLKGFGALPGFLANTPPISLDAVVFNSPPPPVGKDNIKDIFDFKFPCGKKGKKGKMKASQRTKYENAMDPHVVKVIDVLSIV